MILYYQGLELPTYRNIIKEMKVPGSSISYMALRKRTKFRKPWLLKNYMPEGHRVLVDSGCGALNNSKEQLYENKELREIAEHYYSWVSDNIEYIDFYTEFDALQLGKGFIEEYRDSARGQFYDKLVPIWHGDTGNETTVDLHSLAERFGRVGITQTTLKGRDLVPVLNKMANSGVSLHGLAMTKPDIMQAIGWASISSTSWTTPQRYGDTIIWSHNQIKRYPKSMKEQGRRKERYVIQAAGFDWEKIQKDDPKELLRLAIWSLEQLIGSINKKNNRGVTTSMNFDDEGFTDIEDEEVGGVVERATNRVPTATPRDASQKRVIPLIDFDIDTVKVKNAETGKTEDVTRPRIKIRSESMRICDTCFLAAKCPMFESGSTCAYDIPIQVETKEQVQSLMNTLVSMQTQRVLLGKMAEDLEGGQIDPLLSGEIDRLGKLIEKKNTIEQEGFSLTVTAKQQGNMSYVDRIFGDMTDRSFTALPKPVPAEDAMKQLDIPDADIIEDRWEQ